jgi:hypothetical protein
MRPRSVSISTFEPPSSHLTFSSQKTTGLRAYNVLLGRKVGATCSVLTRSLYDDGIEEGRACPLTSNLLGCYLDI